MRDWPEFVPVWPGFAALLQPENTARIIASFAIGEEPAGGRPMQSMIRRTIAAAFFCSLTATCAATTTQIGTTRHFEFHSDPWLNAHHFLYQWARADEDIGEGREKVDVPERAGLESLPAVDRHTWLESLAFYRRNIARLSHFDDSMLEQKIGLLKAGGDVAATPEESIPGLIAALKAAMPVYGRHWWAEHDTANRRWVAAIEPTLRRTEQPFVDLTTRLYGGEWPGEPRRVDVSAYANFRAGYTALGHMVMYSTDPGNQGHYGFEMLIHEVQHAREVAGSARSDLRAAFAAADVPLPRNLWHAIIFYTAGEFARQNAGGEHLPYWEREGFDGFAGWASELELVAKYWQPAIAGRSDRATAFAAMAGDVATAD